MPVFRNTICSMYCQTIQGIGAFFKKAQQVVYPAELFSFSVASPLDPGAAAFYDHNNWGEFAGPTRT